MKYELTDITKIIEDDVVLYKIRALKDFGDVHVGDLGGWIEKEDNLSQEGDCWVYDDAQISDWAQVYGHATVRNKCWVAGKSRVYDNASVAGIAQVFNDAHVFGHAAISGQAFVYDDARVYGHARVTGRALVYEYAQVHDKAVVSDNALVYDHANIYGQAKILECARVNGNAHIHGGAQVYGNATIYGHVKIFECARINDNVHIHGEAQVYGSARVHGNAQVYGNAQIYDDGRVSNNARVYGNAVISQHMYAMYGCVATDLSRDLISNIEAQTGLKCFNNEVYCYKHVRDDLSSLYDETFKYTVNEWIEVIDPDLSHKSCVSGLHVSNAQYWNRNGGEMVLFCKVKLEDIITVQEGKIRCKKLFVIGVCDGLVF